MDRGRTKQPIKKEIAFIYRARSCYRPERRLWMFKDANGKEIGSIEG